MCGSCSVEHMRCQVESKVQIFLEFKSKKVSIGYEKLFEKYSMVVLTLY